MNNNLTSKDKRRAKREASRIATTSATRELTVPTAKAQFRMAAKAATTAAGRELNSAEMKQLVDKYLNTPPSSTTNLTEFNNVLHHDSIITANSTASQRYVLGTYNYSTYNIVLIDGSFSDLQTATERANHWFGAILYRTYLNPTTPTLDVFVIDTDNLDIKKMSQLELLVLYKNSPHKASDKLPELQDS